MTVGRSSSLQAGSSRMRSPESGVAICGKPSGPYFSSGGVDEALMRHPSCTAGAEHEVERVTFGLARSTGMSLVRCDGATVDLATRAEVGVLGQPVLQVGVGELQLHHRAL